MPAMLTIHLNGDGCWPDLPQLMAEDRLIDLMAVEGTPPPIEVAALPGGVQSGRVSVSIRLNLPDGRVVITETTFRLLKQFVRAVEARYGPQD